MKTPNFYHIKPHSHPIMLIIANGRMDDEIKPHTYCGNAQFTNNYVTSQDKLSCKKQD